MLRAKAAAKPKSKAAVKPESRQVGKYLVVDPGVCFGKMTFRGTRVPVETILFYLGTGHSVEYLRKSWPEVSPDAIEEAVRLATDVFLEDYGSKRL